MAIKLMNCPHCEYDSVIMVVEYHQMENSYYYQCKQCDMRGPAYCDDEFAKEAWLSISMKTQDQLEDEV